MKIRHNALYLDLLHDLQDSCPTMDLLEPEWIPKMDYFPGMSTNEFRCLHLAKSFLKKFSTGSRTQSGDAVALDKFLQSNIRCRDWTLDVRDYRDELLVGYFRQEVYRFFNPTPLSPILSNLDSIMELGSTGPGASVQARACDFYTKLFAGPVTYTSSIVRSAYEHHLFKIPDWKHAEEQRRDQFGDPEMVRGNRLTFVPKNVDTSRVICIEPALNMFYQQGIKQLLTRRLKSYFQIDLATQQECNRDLAQIGSAQDSFVTIDIESASDSVSLPMLDSMLPRDVLAWLHYGRSQECQLPNGDWETLHMISSMGNAFTFPLETIIFACIVSAASLADEHVLEKGYHKKAKLVNGRGEYTETCRLPNFGVFGDDIIVTKRVAPKVLRLLGLLGFTANAEKSFLEGPFRESCGGDFFLGSPVRGVYCKSLRTQASRYVTINRLNEWSAQSGIRLQRTLRHLMKTVRYLPIPLYENDDAGVKVPASMVENMKVDANLQATEYRRWECKPQVMRLPEGGIKPPRGAKSRIYNSDALMLAFLRGDINGGTMSIRLGPARYTTKKAITPSWDYVPTADTKVSVGSGRLASAIQRNLNR